MIRDYHAGAWILAAKNHVTSLLTIENELGAWERSNQILSGDIGWELPYRVPVLSSTYSLPASAGTGSSDAMQSST